MLRTPVTQDSTDRDQVLPDWVDTAEKPPWPKETVFVQEGSTFLNETSIMRVEVDGSVYEGFPLGNTSETSGYWPEALWQYDGEIVSISFEEAEFLGSDVRSWSVLGSSGVTKEWENVEWERIPDEIEPTEEDLSSWSSTRDVFGRDMWVNEDVYAVSYSDSLPNSDGTETAVNPPWPEDPTFTHDDKIRATSVGGVSQLLEVKGDNGIVRGFVIDTTPLCLWKEDGEIVEVSDATIKGESLATYFDKLDRFPEYDPEEHRSPIHNVDTSSYIDPQLNDDVGSNSVDGAYIDSLSSVHTPQEDDTHGDWGLTHREISTATTDELLQIYRSSVDREVFEIVDDAVANWVNDPRHANEFYATGKAITGNNKYASSDVAVDTVSAVESYSDFTTAYLKYTEREKVTLYRYLDSEIADDLLDDDTVVSPRSAASWATSMGGAASTADTVWHTDSDGVILEAEIPAENILATSETHGIFNNNEDEMIVALPEEIDLSNMKIHGHGEYNPNN